MATSLADLINRLPRALAARYNKATFWAQAANDVLLDVETRCELPRTKWDFCLPIFEKQLTYAIPVECKKILGVYMPTHAFQLVDYRNTIDWQRRGNQLEIREGNLTVNETPLLTAIVTTAGDSTVSFADPTDPVTVENFCVQVGTDLMAINCGIVAKQASDAGETTVTMKRPWLTVPLTNDGLTFYEHFLVVEYVKGFSRIEDPVADIIDDDEDLLRVMRAGMRYYGEFAAEELSETTNQAFQAYQKILREYVGRTTRGDFKPRPNFDLNIGLMRTIPSRVIGNNSGIFGDREAQG